MEEGDLKGRRFKPRPKRGGVVLLAGPETASEIWDDELAKRGLTDL